VESFEEFSKGFNGRFGESLKAYYDVGREISQQEVDFYDAYYAFDVIYSVGFLNGRRDSHDIYDEPDVIGFDDCVYEIFSWEQARAIHNHAYDFYMYLKELGVPLYGVVLEGKLAGAFVLGLGYDPREMIDYSTGRAMRETSLQDNLN